jgi:formate/nitrite transporter FocA (FNT family)
MGPSDAALLDEQNKKNSESSPSSSAGSHPAPSDEAHKEEKEDNPLEEPQKSYDTILEQEVTSAEEEMERPWLALLLSGLTAGLDLGFGPLTMVVLAATLEPVVTKPTLHVLMANAYAIGFIFVVLGRSALFTEHTTSAVLPVLTGRSSIGKLFRLWGLVFLGNTIGCVIFSAFAAALIPSLVDGSGTQFAELAHRTVSHPSWVMFLSAIMAGWIMGLVSWLVVASRESINQLVCVWLATMVIGLAGFHHSVAGTVEVLTGVMLGQGATFGDYLRFLALAVPGNIIGGTVFVAALKWGHIQQNAG